MLFDKTVTNEISSTIDLFWLRIQTMIFSNLFHATAEQLIQLIKHSNRKKHIHDSMFFRKVEKIVFLKIHIIY